MPTFGVPRLRKNAPLCSTLPALLLALPLFLCLIGCGGGGTDEAGVESSRISMLANFYMTCEVRSDRGVVRSEEQLKEYIGTYQQPTLDEAGLTVDELFVSERDQQPYVLLFGKEAKNPRNGGVVVYEQEGMEGTRYVGFNSGTAGELSEEEFKATVRGKRK